MNCDPNTLLAAAKCFKCIPRGMLPEVQISLLCQWAQGGGCPLPAKATNPLPASGNDHVGALGVALGTGPTLSWNAVPGATSYDVYFNGGFVGNQVGTTYTPATLAYATAYNWQVDPINACGKTTGDLWTFTTAVQFEWTPHATVVSWRDGGGLHSGDYNIGAGNFLATADLRTVFEVTCVSSNLTAILGCQSLPKLKIVHLSDNLIAGTFDARDCVLLEDLDVSLNNLTAVLVDNCTALQIIYIFSNGLVTALDLDTCPAIGACWAYSCNLSTLDLHHLGATISDVDVNNNGNLATLLLPASSNSLANLDASSCLLTGAWNFSVFPNLNIIFIDSNSGITQINASGLAFLTDLLCSALHATFTGPSLAGTNALITFDCSLNPGITAINLSTKGAMQVLDCHSCNLVDCRIGPSPDYNYVDASDNALAAVPVGPAEGVNAILVALDVFPLPRGAGGTVDVDTIATNAAPTVGPPDGVAAAASLVANFWTVNTN